MDASKQHAPLRALVLAAALAVAAHAGHVHAGETPAESTAGPVVQTLYVEIPSGNALTNAMMAKAIGSSTSVKQLIQVMALGETADLQVEVFSASDKLALKAAEAALKSFEGKRLEHLTLGVAVDADKLETLRPLAEPLGVKLVAGKAPR
ncbi:hypothetical protein ARC20_14520 [Stenotrophomonas panacihumi]|uniref:Uncharacterized protein n=1 Tax=Stenotrophomonas panacihumi TaxID=676599 RepID=A0A0R0A0T3_9GAMM|nr:hypothetical protein [Stenotrophomonas panacihumi]KRG38765.1 hypothetical protein ARC20_14520 [Stenotrophomonas panacihumi]PTN55952.1 hypothetical protein C9J98_02435 [Stenotrophomonas panacihumi]